MFSRKNGDGDLIMERRSLKRKAETQESHKDIEKRRRDRINQSLMELSQVIPAAFAKQSTRRLEKAEILEMTVHYVRAIGNTEMGARFQQGDWYSSDIWGDFMHHYQTGYSDCMRELHTYFRSVEGRGDQDQSMNQILAFLQSRYRPESSVADGEAFRRGPTDPEHRPRPTAHSERPRLPLGPEPLHEITPVDANRQPAAAPRLISHLTRQLAVDTKPDSNQHNLIPHVARRMDPDFRFWTLVPFGTHFHSSNSAAYPSLLSHSPHSAYPLLSPVTSSPSLIHVERVSS